MLSVATNTQKCLLDDTKLFIDAQITTSLHNPPYNPLFICSFCHVTHLYLLANLQKNIQNGTICEMLISQTDSDIFSGLRQIWVQEQPTGDGFAAEHHDSLALRMWHGGFTRT